MKSIVRRLKPGLERALCALFAIILVAGLAPAMPASAIEGTAQNAVASAEEEDGDDASQPETAVDADENGESTPQPEEGAKPAAEDEETATATDDIADEKPTVESDQGTTAVVAEAPVAAPVSNAGDAGDGGCHISGLRIMSANDGTAPFDDDDDPGNDSSDSNGIVRSFDYVNYSVEYTTALNDAWGEVSSADVLTSIELPIDPRYASFNDDTLNWCEDRIVTYRYADGTSSTEWDQSREVASQVLTGVRRLVNSGDVNPVPGAATLSVGIYVKGAPDGATIQPTFTLSVAGDGREMSATPDPVKVSAAPKYNVKLQRYTSYMSKQGYFDFENGTVSREDAEGTVLGRHEGFGISLQLRNDTAGKGLKGIELPDGDITFDLTVTTTLDGEDVSTGTEWSPLLWDYKDNNSTGNGLHSTGVLGHDMAPYETGQSYLWQSAPWNVGSTDYSSCPGGGSFTITQDENNPTVYHVVLTGYSFDLEDYTFPHYNNQYTPELYSPQYGENIGFVSVGYVQFVAQYPRQVDSTSNLQLTAQVSNLEANSISGAKSTTDAYSGDDTSGFRVTLYSPGTISKYIQYTSVAGGRANSVWNAGDAYGPIGTSTSVRSSLTYTGDDTITAANLLMKFDDSALEVPAGTTKESSWSLASSDFSVGSVTTLFAAKMDGTGWTDQSEMNLASEENLIFFDTVDELTEAGYTCVGILYQIRDASIYGARDSVFSVGNTLHVKEDAEPGYVATIVNDMRAWINGAEADVWENHPNDRVSGAYGIGDGSMDRGTYTDWYADPYVDMYREYSATRYENGTVAGGHTGGVRYGDSLLLVGAKNGITISNVDDKTIYDLDNGERTAAFTVQPTLTVASSTTETPSVGLSTILHAQVTLPSDLHYDTGSATLTPTSVTVNDDGTTTILWDIPAEVGQSIEPIEFTATIGAAGTPQDVGNNASIEVEAQITSDLDSRKVSAGNGNLSTCSFHVIKLASCALSKSTPDSILEVGDAGTWVLNAGNSSQVDIEGARMVDVLPYDGDPRGSEFAGAYRITFVTLDCTNAPGMADALAGTEALSSTDDAAVRSMTNAQLLNYQDGLTWASHGIAERDGERLTWHVDSSEAKALRFDIGALAADSYISVEVGVDPTDGAGNLLEDAEGGVQLPGSTYVNAFAEFADNQAAVVSSNNAKMYTASRALSGVAFFDADGDSARGEGDPLLSGIDVTLYRTDRDAHGGDPVNVQMGRDIVPLYPAYQVLGSLVDPVSTGTDGSYRFDDLPQGRYVVVFSGGGMEKWTMIEQDTAADDVDSDASPTLDEAAETLGSGYLSAELPALADLPDAFFESEHNDAGFAPYAAELAIGKSERGTGTPLAGALFSVEDADGGYLEFADGVHTGTVSSSPEGSALVESGKDGTVSLSGIPLGSFSVEEQMAPDGYFEDDAVRSVSVEPAAHYVGDEVAWDVDVLVDGKAGAAAEFEDEPCLTSVSVEKRWNDDGNRDGLRQDAVFDLVGTVAVDGRLATVVERELTLSADENPAKATVDALPAYTHGQQVRYSLEERPMDGYSVVFSPIKGNWKEGWAFIASNGHAIEMTSVSVKKAWSDDCDRDGVRPDAISVVLNGSDGSTRMMTLSDDTGWAGVFSYLPANSGEGKIEYTVTELIVPEGYEAAVAGDAEGGFTITNIHDPETISIPVKKVWDDDDDRDGVRPDAVKVTLAGSDGSSRELTLAAESGWKGSFDDLPKFMAGGTVIEYALSEEVVEGYSSSIEGDAVAGFTVTNSHEPETVSIPIAKVWNDDGDRDGIRPDAVNVMLVGSDGSERTLELSAENGWAASFDDLPKYADHGTVIEYTASEPAVPDGYTASVAGDAAAGFTVTNAHGIETISIPVEKLWNDDGDRDGLRPDAVSVMLTGSDGSERTLELTASANWKGSFSNLPKYMDGGKEIAYSLAEKAVEGYETAIEGDAGSGFAVANSHIAETTSFTVTKVWDDAGNQDGVRPESIEVALTGSDGSRRTADLSAESGWAASFDDLPVYMDHGVKIAYALVETPVDGYTHAISFDEAAGLFTISNTHVPAEMSVPVSKNWDDDDDRDGVRPDAVTVVLSGTDGSERELTLNAEDGWAGSFSGLPVFHDQGIEIQYSIAEEAVEGYKAEIAGSVGDGFVVTNAHDPETISIPVEKLWNDDDDRDGVRPDAVSVVLAGSDGSERSLELTAQDGWKGAFDDLPKFMAGGTEIEYSVAEPDAPEGYEATMTGDTEGGFTITNTHAVETVDIPVSKTWDDDDDRDGMRPDAVKVTLAGSDGSSRELTLAAEGGWAGTFPSLPKYMDGGKEIAYSLAETAVEGYEAAIKGDAAGGFSVTNRHAIETISIPVSKTWADADDQDGIRPDEVTVVLTGSDGSSRSIALRASDGWTGSFNDLPKFMEGGTVIEYALSEEPVEGYETAIKGDATSGFTVSNSHDPETISIPVTKVWNDGNDQDGIRSGGVKVTLAGSDGSSRELSLTEQTGWQGAFDDLPRYMDGGMPIGYTLSEDPVDGYASSIEGDQDGGYTVSNTHDPAKLDIRVEKAWNDENDRDGIRPDAVSVVLTGSDGSERTLELSAENGWAASFDDLPKFMDGGTEIEYSVAESDTPEGYETAVTGDAEGGFTITNTHAIETVDIPVSKVWDDDDDRDGMRPDAVTVTLDGSDGSSRQLTLAAEGGWAGTFPSLPKYMDGGKEIAYSLAETAVEGYEAAIKGDATSGFSVTNRHAIETISIPVSKTWADADDQDGIRPDEVTVVLTGSDGSSRSIALRASDGWTGSFNDLPKYMAGGTSIEYALSEETVEGYVSSVEGDAAGGFTVANSHDPETISIPVAKVWNDADDQDGIRPGAVKVTLAGSDGSSRKLTLSAEGGWTGSFDDLPRYMDGGMPIGYTLSEDPVDGYASSIEGDQDGGYTVSNTHDPAKLDIRVEKAWNDENDRDGIRPGDVTVVLSGSDGSHRELVLTEEAGWAGAFSELPRHSSLGQAISYAISEYPIEGYSPTIEGDSESGFKITNTHAVETVNIPVSKTWDDDDDRDGIRPDSVTVFLAGSDGSHRELELSAENGWNAVFAALPKYVDGSGEVVYTLSEEPVDGYASSIEGDSANGFSVVNVHEPETVEIPVSKIWEDDGDRDGVRTDGVAVTLAGSDGTERSLELNEQNNWSGSFSDLPKYMDGGALVEYAVDEETVEGYEAVIGGDSDVGFTITNIHDPETISIPVEKVWDDADDQDGIRPDAVSVVLTGSDGSERSLELTAEQNWKSSFEDLPRFMDGGEEISYTLEEDPVEGYETAIEGETPSGFTVTNSHAPENPAATPPQGSSDSPGKGGSYGKTGAASPVAPLAALAVVGAAVAATGIVGIRSRKAEESKADQ